MLGVEWAFVSTFVRGFRTNSRFFHAKPQAGIKVKRKDFEP
jgi:hypothetical protein